MFARSKMEEFLSANMVVDGKQYCVYGDAAYRLRPWMRTAYPRRTATEDQAVFNVAMNAVRTAVEWSYGEVKQRSTIQDFKRAIKLRQGPVAELYVAAVLLHNFRICHGYGGQVAHYFGIRAPTLDAYVNFM